jgi:hypothetical protein
MTNTMERAQSEQTSVGARTRWPLWGAAAGVGGVVANLLTQPSVQNSDRRDAEKVVDALSRGSYHVAVVFAFAAVVCLVLFAAGLSRWAARQATPSLALPAAVFGLVASAGAMIGAYGVKGQLAEYLQGGTNADNYGTSALYTYFLFDDLAGFFSWFGVAVAAGCLAWLAFRERLLARWVGALFALMAIFPAVLLVAFGFAGFAGVICPVLLIPATIGMALARE